MTDESDMWLIEETFEWLLYRAGGFLSWLRKEDSKPWIIFSLLVWAVFIWFSTCANLQAQPKEEEKKYEFGDIGEGFSSEDLSKGISVRWRMFSAPDMPALCASTGKPAKLIAREDHIKVTVDEPFSLADLSIVALDSAGRPLKPIPITVGCDADINEFIDISEFRRTGDGIVPRHAGTFRVLIRPLCSGPDHDGPGSIRVVIYYDIKAK